MTRRNRRQPIGIALFPFLAVLICTMGALIVLLVLTVQQARKSAVAEQAFHNPTDGLLRPAPFYLRSADAAPSSDPPPVILP